MNDKPQFTAAAEVRELMGDVLGDVYDNIFGKLTEEEVLAMVASGMHYTDGLPVINYDKSKDRVANHAIAMTNVKIRRQVTCDSDAQCLQIESERAIVAGMVELACELVENISEEEKVKMKQAQELRAQAKLQSPNAQFVDIADVREFMGKFFYPVFAMCGDKHVMCLIETGMVYEDNLPLIKYDTSLSMKRNHIIVENNIKIRMTLTSDNLETCVRAEKRRANAAGITGSLTIIAAEFE